MSAFTPSEIEYLTSQTLGRIATVGPDGQPHVTPVTYFYNASEDTLDVGGLFFEKPRSGATVRKTRK